MLKQTNETATDYVVSQPPSGGCVLKLLFDSKLFCVFGPAAFGRLCVETYKGNQRQLNAYQPPSGGCVLKLYKCHVSIKFNIQPPSGGCVLKQ